MTWPELETILRGHAAQQPRGFAAQLARKLEIKPPTVAQVLAGDKRIPPEWLGPMLELMGLELVVQRKF
ncbi:helix-turn-helix domain-containing protein [Deinococcus sp. HMF7604]|uniref:helix-turn-helix domain-containing protein n=1 Tax=Deinococcus betulae TaxID=2873312 RepID=UPI001CCB6B57|nr:helix-turn-helix domain-containing protein [Deinococcus betulae]MBZ9750737.1 helix-turn-helix domain-containing protein [Deinococcus betulae]